MSSDHVTSDEATSGDATSQDPSVAAWRAFCETMFHWWGQFSAHGQRFAPVNNFAPLPDEGDMHTPKERALLLGRLAAGDRGGTGDRLRSFSRSRLLGDRSDNSLG